MCVAANAHMPSLSSTEHQASPRQRPLRALVLHISPTHLVHVTHATTTVPCVQQPVSPQPTGRRHKDNKIRYLRRNGLSRGLNAAPTAGCRALQQYRCCLHSSSTWAGRPRSSCSLLAPAGVCSLPALAPEAPSAPAKAPGPPSPRRTVPAAQATPRRCPPTRAATTRCPDTH